MKKCHINKRRKQKVKEKDWAITNNMTGRVWVCESVYFSYILDRERSFWSSCWMISVNASFRVSFVENPAHHWGRERIRSISRFHWVHTWTEKRQINTHIYTHTHTHTHTHE
jgi:hypothetical protein